MTETQKFPIPTAEREDLEEALGLIYHKREEGEKRAAEIRRAMEHGVGPEAYARVIAEGYAREEGAAIVLTASGESLGADITRRHRLAERLLTDVLSLDRQAVDPNACQLEHIISREVTDSICTSWAILGNAPTATRFPPATAAGGPRPRFLRSSCP